ncbi:MAG: histidinol-phosphatase HisJ family protein [Bacillota bacterium]|nr:histidinol-phosphatase HisJ family protein [Bacillota bacterium]
MIDYHLHTSRCCHASGTLVEYLETARKINLKEIGFADHFPLDLLEYTPRAQVTMKGDELAEYMSQVNSLKNSPDGVIIKLGIEIDYIPEKESKIAEVIGQYQFDYIIGSIHFMDGWDFTHPRYADDYAARDIAGLYRTYFELVWAACGSRLFDIIGHLDVIKKFGYRPDEDLEPYWVKTAQILKETDTCLELNTAGRDVPVGEFYPDRRMLEICSAEGVPLTVGSDAHSPEQVGRYFDQAEDLLREVGYKELAVFEKRIRRSIPL